MLASRVVLLIALLALAGCEDSPTLKPDPIVAAAAAYPEGETIYNTYCISCHQTGISGAYRFGDAAAWREELREHSLDEMVAEAIAGEGAMPARGLCSQCSDEQIRASTLYMIIGSGISPDELD